MADAKPSKAGHSVNPADNVAAAVTLAAAGAGNFNVLSQVFYSYDAAPTAGTLTIADGAVTVFLIDITAAGPSQFTFNPPLEGSANTALVVTLAAAGAAVGGNVSVHAWTE